MSISEFEPTTEQDLERVLLTLSISPELDQLLEELAERIEGDKTEVFRKALGLLKTASDARAEGKRVGIVTGDAPLDVEFIGI